MSGLYDINTTVIKTKTYLEPGIHENLEMTEVKYETTENSEFLAFYFKDADGNKHVSHTEWPKKTSTSIDKMNDEEKALFIGLINRQKKLVHQIVSAILEKEVPLTGNSFKEFALNTVKVLKGNFEGKKVRAKIVYDYRGYTSLANNPDFRFIEPMSVLKEKSEISILDNDRMTRDNIKGNERKNNVINIIDSEDPSLNNRPTSNKTDIPF